MRLSPREFEVARYVAADMTDKTIAANMGVTIETVREYLERIGKKLSLARGGLSLRRRIARWYEAKAAA